MNKELFKLDNEEMNNWINKWAKDPKRYLTKKDVLMANKHRKRCSTSCHEGITYL